MPTARKLGLVTRAFGASMLPRATEGGGPLAATEFLVLAAATRPRAPAPAAPGGVRGRALWVLALFEELERRERARLVPLSLAGSGDVAEELRRSAL